jgi:hypothetical protein
LAHETQFITHDIVTDLEDIFPYKDLFDCEYFQTQRRGFYDAQEAGLLNRFRNYAILLRNIAEIYGYDQQHALSFAKRFRDRAKDWRGCESIFSEIIVYRSYLRQVHEGTIRKIRLEEKEADIIIERIDETEMFLESFCVMPDFPRSEDGVYSVLTHTQWAKASIRQKLLGKIENQRQFTKPRENFAVIELNDISIAGDFTVWSSLSDGYKLTLGQESKQVLAEGYDWRNSIFDDTRTKFLKAVIYFNLGDYDSRRFVFNPNFCTRPV